MDAHALNTTRKWRMSGFVVGDNFFFVRRNILFSFQSADTSVNGLVEIIYIYLCFSLRAATNAASLQTFAILLPPNPGVKEANFSGVTVSPNLVSFFRCTLNICFSFGPACR